MRLWPSHHHKAPHDKFKCSVSSNTCVISSHSFKKKTQLQQSNCCTYPTLLCRELPGPNWLYTIPRRWTAKRSASLFLQLELSVQKGNHNHLHNCPPRYKPTSISSSIRCLFTPFPRAKVHKGVIKELGIQRRGSWVPPPSTEGNPTDNNHESHHKLLAQR